MKKQKKKTIKFLSMILMIFMGFLLMLIPSPDNNLLFLILSRIFGLFLIFVGFQIEKSFRS